MSNVCSILNELLLDKSVDVFGAVVVGTVLPTGQERQSDVHRWVTNATSRCNLAMPGTKPAAAASTATMGKFLRRRSS